MVTFTREDRRGRVLEHHSQGMGTREISKLLHMSFTDIAKILKDSDKEKESEQQRTRQEFLSSQAYTLFSEGKSPVQVAIELNIRASEAIIFQREYWELEGLHNLNQIYQEIKDGTWNFVNLWKSVKAAGMNIQHVHRLLTIANNDLSAVESRYERLKKEASTLEFQKASSARDSELLNNQIIMMRKTLDSTRLDYEKEMERFRHLQQEIMKLESIVKHFKNSDEEYINIVNTIKDKVHNTYQIRKLLQLALLSLSESTRADPDKYSSLICYNRMSSAGDNCNQHYSSYKHRQYDYDIEDCKAILLDEAEKLYTGLEKIIVDEIINEYVSKTSVAAASLPMLSYDPKQQGQYSSTSLNNS